jgi:hypothetical protein
VSLAGILFPQEQTWAGFIPAHFFALVERVPLTSGNNKAFFVVIYIERRGWFFPI